MVEELVVVSIEGINYEDAAPTDYISLCAVQILAQLNLPACRNTAEAKQMLLREIERSPDLCNRLDGLIENALQTVMAPACNNQERSALAKQFVDASFGCRINLIDSKERCLTHNDEDFFMHRLNKMKLFLRTPC